jgi:hypothetical protein
MPTNGMGQRPDASRVTAEQISGEAPRRRREQQRRRLRSAKLVRTVGGTAKALGLFPLLEDGVAPFRGGGSGCRPAWDFGFRL